MLFLSPYLLSIYIVEAIILTLSFIGLFWAIKISLDFDINNTTSYQYSLASRSYLVAVIIMFILIVKLPIFLYFIWTMNTLSDIVPGAMCSAGIVSASKYGTIMLGLKIVNLFFLLGWILLNRYDLNSPLSTYTKLKFTLYQPLFFLLVCEFILQLTHFSQISIKTPVACCSVIFSQNSINSLPFFQQHWFILGLFFTTLAFYCISGFFKRTIIFFTSSIAFALSAIYAVIRFFSPYIYELPTHLCPFCMLQKEYYYIGYVIYVLLFLGVLFPWFGLISTMLKRPTSSYVYKFGIISNLILSFILLLYPLIYFIKNGVWL